jgi:hypothetical protein
MIMPWPYLEASARGLEEAKEGSNPRIQGKECKSLDGYRTIQERVAGACGRKIEPKRVWEEKGILACQEVLKKEDRFLKQAREVVSRWPTSGICRRAISS